jgi:hypothetical protein
MIDSTSSPDLLTALEANMVAFWSSYGRAAGCRLERTRDIVWFYTGIQHPLFNGVVSVKSPMAELEGTFEQLKQTIASQGAPALWWIGPQSVPEDLGSVLLKRGLQPAGEVPGMALDLDLLGDEPRVLADFTITKVNTVEMQEKWAQTTAVGTGFSDTAADTMARIEATLADPAYRAQTVILGC